MTRRAKGSRNPWRPAYQLRPCETALGDTLVVMPVLSGYRPGTWIVLRVSQTGRWLGAVVDLPTEAAARAERKSLKRHHKRLAAEFGERCKARRKARKAHA